MRHPHRSQITALGAASLLLLVSCGSAEEAQEPASEENLQESQEPEATPDSEDVAESEDLKESEDPAASEQPEESESSPASANDPDQGPDDDAASADFSTEAQESEGFPGEFTRGEEPQHLVDVRSGTHEGYDRVVFEFTGDGTPSWRGEYTDAAAELGRGEPIELAGEHLLEININGPSWALGDEPEDELPAQEYYERDLDRAFEEIFIQGPFEAHSQYLIGMDQERPFQIGLLEDPTRLVVDISTDQ